jgi:glutathione synthase/RimK-type ligase-like ATP-grasp enzyme
MSSYRVALATYSALSELSDDDRLLLAELWTLGVEAEPAVWDDASVDWKRYDAVVIRSTWDYHLSPASFFAWLARLEALGVALWNPAPVVRANADKSYLKELEARGVSVVPTLWIEKGRPVKLDELLEARGWNDAVVKPVISGGAYRTSRVKRGDPAGQAALDDVLAHSNAMVQPFLAEIAAEGEWSFIFLGGEFSHAVLKTVRAGDFRVQEQHGGRTERREPPPALLAQAREAAIAGPAPWLYARVDGIRRGNELIVIELELIEPFLYLSHSPVAARTLAEAVKARLSSAPRPSPTTRPPSGGRA